LTGYHNHLMLVPAQRFAIILLTNGELRQRLNLELFAKDWALRVAA
jgi:hypothetical protein